MGATIRRVCHTVTIIVGIGIVSNVVSIRIHRFSRIQWEGITGIRHTVTIIVRIGVISSTITVRIDGFSGIERERIAGIGDAVTIVIVVRRIHCPVTVCIDFGQDSGCSSLCIEFRFGNRTLHQFIRFTGNRVL